MRKLKLGLINVAACAALVGGWLMLGPAANPVHAETGDAMTVEGVGLLDGMTFASELGPADKPANVEDLLVFENGMFVSKECERRCGYAPAPYFVRSVGAKTEFISETKCLGNDATIVWRGTVDEENGTIKGMFTWTSERWYWTIEKEFWFEGTLAEAAISMTSDR